MSLLSEFYHSERRNHKIVEPLLELRRVTVAFQTADGPRPVLTDINLTLAPGEFVALVGPNGSGKSTLGRVLAGLCPVSRGEIRGALVPASAERDARSRRTSGGRRSAGSVPRAALVFQNPEAQIIGETVYEDVCFGLENLAVPPTEMHRRAMEALQRVGLADLADTSVTRLSGGQKQLLAVASNLVLDPRLIVFDESTAMLDPAARRLVLDTARNLTESGTTVVWITQWMDETAVAPRVIALHHGRIVHDGDARTFFYGGACETLGFTAPYTVRVARALADRGLYLPEQPLTPSELAAAVAAARQRTERPVHAGAGPTGGSAR